MNVICISGRITDDPELRKTNSGKSVCSFSLAVDDGYGDNKKTYFHQFVAWEGKAEYLCSYGFKGAWIETKGKLTHRDYEGQNGKKRITEILVDEIRICGKKETQNNHSQPQETYYEEPSPSYSINFDDLPF